MQTIAANEIFSHSLFFKVTVKLLFFIVQVYKYFINYSEKNVFLLLICFSMIKTSYSLSESHGFTIKMEQ